MRPSVDEWIKKWWYIYTVEYYATVKKEGSKSYLLSKAKDLYDLKRNQSVEILPFGTAWMDLEIIVLNEISQSEKDIYHMISHTWTLMNK